MMMTITNAIRRSEMITPTTAPTAPEPPSLLLVGFEVLATDDVVTVQVVTAGLACNRNY